MIISIIITTTVAFGLAAVSMFSLGTLVGCSAAIAVVVALASLGNLRLGPVAPRPHWTAAFPAVLVAAVRGCISPRRRRNMCVGGRDPGVYITQGIQIAQTQSLVTTDPVAAAVPASTRDLFFPSYS